MSERIEEVLGVFGFPRVEARSREDDGVRQYVQPVDVELRWVELGEAADVLTYERDRDLLANLVEPAEWVFRQLRRTA